RQKSVDTEREPLTPEEMVKAIRHSQGASAAAAAQAIMTWAADHEPQLRVWFSSHETGSFMPGLDLPGGPYLFPVAIYAGGEVEIQFQRMIGRPQPPFDRLDKRRELQERLNTINGVAIADDRLNKRPGFWLSALATEEAREQFLKTLDWAFIQAV